MFPCIPRLGVPRWHLLWWSSTCSQVRNIRGLSSEGESHNSLFLVIFIQLMHLHDMTKLLIPFKREFCAPWYLYTQLNSCKNDVSVGVIVLGAFFAGARDLSFDFYGYAVVFLANITTAVYLATIARTGTLVIRFLQVITFPLASFEISLTQV